MVTTSIKSQCTVKYQQWITTVSRFQYLKSPCTESNTQESYRIFMDGLTAFTVCSVRGSESFG